MSLLGTLTLIFASASVMLFAMHYFNHPAIPGYILAGLVIAPFVEGTELLTLAQVGILFLVFIFGLKFDPGEIVSVARSTTLATVLQLLITGSIGYAVAAQLGLSSFEGLVLALACSLSSTLIGLELAEQEIHRDLLHGRLAESMHLIQDVLGLVLLAVLFADGPTGAVTAGVISVGFIVAALAVRQYVFTAVGRSISYNAEVLMLLGFSTLLVSVYAASYFGLPGVIGAFAAGIAGAKFPYNMELLDSFGSIKDFFAAIFFVTLGALVGVPTVTTAVIGVVVFLVTTVVKPYITAELFQHFGYTDRASTLTGLSMNQVSELSFILVIQGLVGSMISPAVFDGVILGGVASMLVSSYAKSYEETLYALIRGDRRVTVQLNDHGHVIVVGADLPGRRVAKYLAEHSELDVVVVDNDAEKLEWVDETTGVTGVHGDVMNDEVLDALNASDASLIVSTALQARVSASVIGVDGPDHIVYASNVVEAERFYDEGASYVIVPDLAVAEELADGLEHVDSAAGRAMLRESGKALLREAYDELDSLR
jgi:CPA2 family monovalent cation:H+ antiporter-2